jgi:hypothetical protein
VGHEDERHAAFPPKVCQETHDPRTHRYVKHLQRLVGNEELGPQNRRRGDADALPLPPRELVRIAVEEVTRRR